MGKGKSLTRKVKYVVFGLLAVGVIAVVLLALSIQHTLSEERKYSSQHMVETVCAFLDRYDALMNKGSATPEEARSAAVAIIENLRYRKNQYFWVIDPGNTMIVEPFAPELKGKDVSGYRDSSGTLPFAAAAAMCRSSGEGFIEYYWPKPGSTDPEKKKVFVKLFKPWGWIIGTGFYVADAVNEAPVIRQLAIGALVVFPLGIILMFYWVGRSVFHPVSGAILGLIGISKNLFTAANQISTAGQALAQASSEQAAALQETSASLEELSSVTRCNADNALQADSLMQDANRVVEEADKSMIQLTAFMEDISRSSRETSKIIKTIDEIAFQTNLLALNAAVEAARAGNAGAGFAVVADEVRSLAMRAAEAAKSTASLIEGTVGKISDGAVLMSSTNQAFGEVERNASKIAGLVGEIAAASKEQAQSLDHVSLAISDIEKATNQNAAHAEEFASSAQQLRAQSDDINEHIVDLRSLIGARQDRQKQKAKRTTALALSGTDDVLD